MKKNLDTEKDTRWRNKGGTHQEDEWAPEVCPDCGGLGTIDEEICETCDGLGEI